MRIILLSTLMFTFVAQAGPMGAKIKLQEALASELNILLSSTNDLHSALFDQKAEDIDEHTQSVIAGIDRARKKSVLAQVQRTHLLKILEAARDKLVMSQNFKGQKRRNSYQGAFKDLVQIAQVFRLKPYRIYFCSKDKSVWLQSAYKPKNPINPETLGSCGRLVR